MPRRPRKRVAKKLKGKRLRSVRLEKRPPTPPAQRRHNLPTQLTSFVGRDSEIAEIKRLLGTTRLLTLTGAGGCGKTRLALQVAGELPADLRDGVWLVDLAPLSNGALVPRAVAAAVGVPEQPRRSLQDTLVDFLRPRELLLLLDNCEHLLASCAEVANVLLRECPGLRILATSREPLGIAGEIRWTVPSLSLPDLGAPPTAEQLIKSDAVRLFVNRAVAAQAKFAISERNALALAHLCRQLDGIPLAIEMAAAWVRVLTVEEILQRLSDRFQLLKSGSRDTLARHQTLKMAMDWSYALLSEQERLLLSRVSVFSGSWSLHAAEIICGADDIASFEVLDLLTRLVDTSLVLAETYHGEARYRLLETIRQYGWDRLEDAGAATEVRRRHRDWYLAMTEQAEPKLRGHEQEFWFRRLEMEHDNLRAALEWSLTDAGDAEAGMRLAGALAYFWRTRDYFSEGSGWLERALSHDSAVSASVRAKAARTLAYILVLQGEVDRAAAWAEEALALSRQLGDKQSIGQSLWSLGCVALSQTDWGRSKALLEEGLAYSRDAGDITWTANALHQLGELARSRGDYEVGRVFYEESLTIRRAQGDKRGIAACLGNLGLLSIEQGNHRSAAVFLRESLNMSREVGSKQGVIERLAGLAGVAVAEGQPKRVARLLGAAEVGLGKIGGHWYTHDRLEFESRVKAARVALGDAAFAAAWAEGRAMTLEQAIEYALAPTETLERKSKEPDKSAVVKRAGILAPRERAVAALIVEGKTNREIASRLSITESTAETHVQHILNKLGFNSRAQIAAWAVSRGLHTS
jgi:predicted ATPase/DNA-binding CsgD family transcriptional regulator